MRELSARGHRVLFLERDVPWYASHRDLTNPPYGRTALYPNLAALKDRYATAIRDADLVIVGSYVPEGVAVGEWVTRTARGISAFYDIDTPVTLAKLDRGDYEYLSHALIPRYPLYLSFTGGPILERIERRYGSPMARPLYCSFDPTVYYPMDNQPEWEFGFMGTFSADRQSALEQLLLEPARRWKAARMVVAGSLYPPDIEWPANVERIEHVPPAQHRAFYTAQRFTLNITRADMLRAGYSPSVRLFEASACGTPIITDYWEGLATVFQVDKEILVARSSADIMSYLHELPDGERRAIGARAHRRVMAEHTAAQRAAQLEGYVFELLHRQPAPALWNLRFEHRAVVRAP
ncbi:MAG: glycosyltransferase [Chloroflexi bacterium]|nr:glycosyltransferase [Chloroflexota bacterium]